MKLRPSAVTGLLALSAPLTTVYVTPAHAAFDAFLKIDGVDGEATDERHRDEIEVFSWSWGAANREAVGGTGPAVSEITVTKQLDKSSPLLFLKTARGEPAEKVVLRLADVRYEGEAPVFYEIVMEDVLVTSIESGARTDDERLTENITLNFSSVRFSFANRDDEGRYIDLERDEEPIRVTIDNPERERPH